MTHESAPPPVSGDQSRRPLLLGVAMGFVTPMLAFLLFPETVAREYRWFGPTVWSVVAFVGVALLFFQLTRRVGAGLLLGFGCLLLVGAGTCTVVGLAIG